MIVKSINRLEPDVTVVASKRYRPVYIASERQLELKILIEAPRLTQLGEEGGAGLRYVK